MGGAAPSVLAGVHGLPPALTSFVGRAVEVAEVAGLLERSRLVTVCGPGGVGKTRLAAEVAGGVAARFADGVWLVELASVAESAQLPMAVAAALGLQLEAGPSAAESLTALLGRLQLLLVLDNCEHLLAAVARLCGALLAVADDVRILVTSREPVGVAGETRFRLAPLELPRSDDPAAATCEAMILFTDRAGRGNPHFRLTAETVPLAERVVARLDGMPLAIELAAARVEALGLAELLNRLDDRFALLASGDRLAAARHRSLAAAVDWSYRLLSEEDRRVFRFLAVFPGRFTLGGAEVVAGAAAGPAVLHLVDCSLVVPPRPGLDGRDRYVLLDTLRAYGAKRLAEAGEQDQAAAGLAAFALQVAEQAAAGLEGSAGEPSAAAWLDAEDATLHQALTWALEHDRAIALRLALALAPWWHLRGRSPGGYPLLAAAAQHAAPAAEPWCAAQYWLGQLALRTGDFAGALGHFEAVRGAVAARGPSPILAKTLAGRSGALRNLGQVPEAAEDARQALAAAREIGDLTGQALALANLGLASYYAREHYYARDLENTLAWARQAQRIDPADIPGWVARWCNDLLTQALIEVGDVASARRSAAEGLARAREAGDLHSQAMCLDDMTELDRQAGQLAEAKVHLREELEIASRTGNRLDLFNALDQCGHLCAETGRLAPAVTVWAARAARMEDDGLFEVPQDAHRHQDPLWKAGLALGPGRKRAAEERGAAMTLAAATEFATMLALSDAQVSKALPTPGLARLSAREKELVTLVAQGRTDAQIAEQLYISIRTVRSHLDRIRDKTGYRRRADLTRLALQVGLI